VRIPLVKGAAEFPLPASGNVMGTYSGKMIVDTETGWEVVLVEGHSEELTGLRAQSGRAIKLSLLEAQHKIHEVQIRMNGVPVIGGNLSGSINGIISRNGMSRIPFDESGRPMVTFFSLRPPVEIAQQGGGPIFSSYWLSPQSKVPGVIKKPQDGLWTWDFQLASVELMVPANPANKRASLKFSNKGQLFSQFSWSKQIDTGDREGLSIPEEGGWLRFRIPGGHQEFSIGRIQYGGDDGLEVPAGEITQLYPDDESVLVEDPNDASGLVEDPNRRRHLPH
jgi:hypothetical protein